MFKVAENGNTTCAPQNYWYLNKCSYSSTILHSITADEHTGLTSVDSLIHRFLSMIFPDATAVSQETWQPGQHNSHTARVKQMQNQPEPDTHWTRLNKTNNEINQNENVPSCTGRS